MFLLSPYSLVGKFFSLLLFRFRRPAQFDDLVNRRITLEGHCVTKFWIPCIIPSRPTQLGVTVASLRLCVLATFSALHFGLYACCLH
jgi:hypothetical protein